MKKYLVVDDRSDRIRALRGAVEVLGKRGIHVTLEHEENVRRLVDRDEYSVERLASYDAFFIDFELHTNQYFGEQPIEFRLEINGQSLGSPEIMIVPVTTGIGLLHYLTSLFRTDEYQAERNAQAEHLPARHRAAHLFSFVEIGGIQSKFFATAACSWFGAEYFRALPSATILGAMLQDLNAWKTSLQPKLVRDAVPAFDRLMDCKLESGPYKWGSLPEAYDWLRFYLEAGGRLGSLPEFRDVVARRTAMKVGWQNASREYSERLDPIQDALKGFLEAYTPGSTDEWVPEPFALSDRPDRFFEVLSHSPSFWNEPDVRFALKSHRANNDVRLLLDE